MSEKVFTDGWKNVLVFWNKNKLSPMGPIETMSFLIQKKEKKQGIMF